MLAVGSTTGSCAKNWDQLNTEVRLHFTADSLSTSERCLRLSQLLRKNIAPRYKVA